MLKSAMKNIEEGKGLEIQKKNWHIDIISYHQSNKTYRLKSKTDKRTLETDVDAHYKKTLDVFLNIYGNIHYAYIGDILIT